jgi:hypothetical protein
MVQAVGFHVEKMNALQFTMDDTPNQNAAAIGTELAALADTLKVDPSGGTLVWPLAGPYVFNWPTPVAQNTAGFDSFSIELFFENEPNSRMVVNVSITLSATDGGASAGNSNSSSYIGTSSSS